MGKINDSLLGGTSGRTGRIVVANVYGNEITRVRPKKRTKKPSTNQELIQNRMKHCAQFIASYKGFACKHYGVRIGMKSCYNLAMTNLMVNFEIDTATKSIIPQYPNLSFSKGSLLAPLPLSISSPSASAVEITWQDNSGVVLDRSTDLAQILIAIENQNNTMFLENVATRNLEAYTVNLPASTSGQTVHVWLAFRDETETMVSNSIYLGSVLVT
nr:DUF6266 family protein [uncultured Flavobacterium sp.]